MHIEFLLLPANTVNMDFVREIVATSYQKYGFCFVLIIWQIWHFRSILPENQVLRAALMDEALLCNLFTLIVAKCNELEIALSIWPRERDEQEFLGERLFKMCSMDLIRARAFLIIVILYIQSLLFVIFFLLLLVLYLYLFIKSAKYFSIQIAILNNSWKLHGVSIFWSLQGNVYVKKIYMRIENLQFVIRTRNMSITLLLKCLQKFVFHLSPFLPPSILTLSLSHFLQASPYLLSFFHVFFHLLLCSSFPSLLTVYRNKTS